MDGRIGLVVVCAVAGGAWALLVLALLLSRLRDRRSGAQPAPVPADAEWPLLDDPLDRVRLGTIGDDVITGGGGRDGCTGGKGRDTLRSCETPARR